MHDEPFNVGRSEDNVRIADIAELVSAAVPGSSVELAKDAGPRPAQLPGRLRQAERHVRRPTAAVDRPGGGRRAGRRPTTTTASTHDEFQSSRFTRLRRIKELLAAGFVDELLLPADRRRFRDARPVPSRRRSPHEHRDALPAVRHAADQHVRRPGDVAAVRELPARGPARLPETFYPLNVRICDACLLVQLPGVPRARTTSSPTTPTSPPTPTAGSSTPAASSRTWQRGCDLGAGSLVVEVASNDGYLLQHVVARGIPVLGIEPAANIAAVARDRGIRTECLFLGEATGKDVANRYGQGRPGRRQQRLRPCSGPASTSFAGFARWSPTTARCRWSSRTCCASSRGDSTTRSTTSTTRTSRCAPRRKHWPPVTYGSWMWRRCRPTAARCASSPGRPSPPGPRRSGSRTSWRPRRRPDCTPSRATGDFSRAVLEVKSDLVSFLVDAARRGRSTAGYGAPGKGNTLLNHCGIRSDLLPFTVDRSPHKQGMFLPGSHIPVHAPERLAEVRPDYVVILPWNLREEVAPPARRTHGTWGAQFVVPIPRLEII